MTTVCNLIALSRTGWRQHASRGHNRPGVGRLRRGEPGEPDAHLAAVPAGHPGQQRKRMFPAQPRLCGQLGRELRVAKPGQGAGLACRVADPPVDVKRLLVVGDGLPVVGELTVCVGDAVQGVRRATAAARLAVQLKRAAAVPQRLGVLPEVRVDPADRILRVGDRCPVGERTAQP